MHLSNIKSFSIKTKLLWLKGYEIVVEIDGTKSAINLDDLYPSIKDWHTATDFAMKMAREANPDAVHIDFIECGEYELEGYEGIDYIHEAPFRVQ